MRRALLLIATFLASCAETHESELRLSADKLKEFILHANAGSISVRNAPVGTSECILKLKESGGEEGLGAEKRFQVSRTDARIRLNTRQGEEGLRLDVELLVPKGITIEAVLRTGDITLDGSFATVAATTTTGNVSAKLSACEGVSLKSRTGNVKLETDERAPKKDIRCETITGDVWVGIAGGFRGPIQLNSGSAKFDFGKELKVSLLVDPDRKSARGFAGTPMTPDELAEAHKTGVWPPGVWGVTKTGTVAFRVR